MKLLLTFLLSFAILLAVVRSAPTIGNTDVSAEDFGEDIEVDLDMVERDVDEVEDDDEFDLTTRSLDDDESEDNFAEVEERDEDTDIIARELLEEIDDEELVVREIEETEFDTEHEFEDGHELTEREAEHHHEMFEAGNSTALFKRASGHVFYFHNKCKSAVAPTFADTRCGYSPRCGDAASYKAKQPGDLKPGKTAKYRVPNKWVGRVFNRKNKKCGKKGENCTMGEFNLDTGSQWTPHAYDISNIQGFTQSIAIRGEGCPTVTCRKASCSCKQAYPKGDMAGKCGTNAVDQPVRACSGANKAFRVTFCP